MVLQPYNINVNIWAFEFAKSLATPSLTYAMLLLSESFFLVLPFLLIYMYIKRDRDVYALAISIIALDIVSNVMKLVVKEVRPCSIPQLSWINNVSCDNSFSFPSTHAVLLTGLTAFLNRYRIVQALYILWLALVLFGRVYLGLHYLTDVVAGVIIGILVSYAIYIFKGRIGDAAVKYVRLVDKRWRL